MLSSVEFLISLFLHNLNKGCGIPGDAIMSFKSTNIKMIRKQLIIDDSLDMWILDRED